MFTKKEKSLDCIGIIWQYFQADDYGTQVTFSQIFLDAATVIQSTFNNRISSPDRTFSVSITNITTLPNSIEMPKPWLLLQLLLLLSVHEINFKFLYMLMLCDVLLI